MFASSGDQSTFSTLFWQGGGTGVAFFFILSGFVLTWSARGTDTVTAFWRRRFFKIYPNHVVTFVAAFIVLGVLSGTVIDNRDALMTLFLQQAWSPSLEARLAVNPVAWTLACEAVFYLCFPFLLRLVERIRPQHLWASAGAVVAAIFLVPSAATMLPDEPVIPFLGVSDWHFWFIYMFPPVRMLDFIFGIVLARIVMTGRRLPVGLGGAIALTVAAYAVTPLFPVTYTWVATMIVPLGLVIAAGAVTDIEGRPTLMSSRAMVWLGEISFAFYLWHYMVLKYGHQVLGTGKTWGTPAALAIIAVLLGVSLLLSWLLYSFVERPIMRRFASGRTKPLPVSEPVG